ncbi:MAG TPA: lipid A biosynthesis lauroyl acyltransferase [Xanthobacteraceae bacterium]|nr:lipid A biosynthesis lauroyl acyltransferase [Xanthobacteraceae bacterium]
MANRPQTPARALLRRLSPLRRLTPMLAAATGGLTLALLRAIRLTDRRRTADFWGWLLRKIGPRLREHRLGRANLIAAFPDKPAAEIEHILAGVWDNLGRYGVEFAQIDRFSNADPSRPDDDIVADPRTSALFHELRHDGKPALIFAAHLANWELPALVAARHGLDTAVLYRPPNIRAAVDAVLKIRAGSMGTLVATGLDAPVRLLHMLEANRHVAMLVDQHFVKGVDVTFFGRPCKANPLIAQLARHVECPIHGTRIVRRADDKNRFTIEMTPAIVPARDAQGLIDIAGTMQVITTVIEGWVREHPEQWLWLHRRWR